MLAIMDIHNSIMDIHNWIMDIHNYRVCALSASHVTRYATIMFFLKVNDTTDYINHIYRYPIYKTLQHIHI